jgi:hypothetical protein
MILSSCRTILAVTVVLETTIIGVGFTLQPHYRPYPEEPPAAAYGGYAFGAVLMAVAPLAVLVTAAILGMTLVPGITHAHPFAFGGYLLNNSGIVEGGADSGAGGQGR